MITSFTKKEKKKIKVWAESKKGKREIKEIMDKAYKDAKCYRKLTKIDREILETPFDI